MATEEGEPSNARLTTSAVTGSETSGRGPKSESPEWAALQAENGRLKRLSEGKAHEAITEMFKRIEPAIAGNTKGEYRHGTSFDGLMGILSDGYMKGMWPRVLGSFGVFVDPRPATETWSSEADIARILGSNVALGFAVTRAYERKSLPVLLRISSVPGSRLLFGPSLTLRYRQLYFGRIRPVNIEVLSTLNRRWIPLSELIAPVEQTRAPAGLPKGAGAETQVRPETQKDNVEAVLDIRDSRRAVAQQTTFGIWLTKFARWRTQERPVDLNGRPNFAQQSMMYRNFAGLDVPKGLKTVAPKSDVRNYQENLFNKTGGLLNDILTRKGLDALLSISKTAGFSAERMSRALDVYGPHRVASFLIEHGSRPDLGRLLDEEFPDRSEMKTNLFALKAEVSIYRGTFLDDRLLTKIMAMDWSEYADDPIRPEVSGSRRAYPENPTHFSADKALAASFVITHEGDKGKYRVVIEARIPGSELRPAPDTASRLSVRRLAEAEVRATSISPERIAALSFLFTDGRVVLVPGDLLRKRDFNGIRELFRRQRIPQEQWPKALRADEAIGDDTSSYENQTARNAAKVNSDPSSHDPWNFR